MVSSDRVVKLSNFSLGKAFALLHFNILGEQHGTFVDFSLPESVAIHCQHVLPGSIRVGLFTSVPQHKLTYVAFTICYIYTPKQSQTIDKFVFYFDTRIYSVQFNSVYCCSMG